MSAATAELADQIRGQARIRVGLANYNDLELLQPRVVGALLRFARFEPGGEPADQSAHDGMQVLPLDEVTRIQVRKSAAGKGAVIGLVVGGFSRSLNSLCLLRGAFTLSKLVLFVI